ncbi:MAG: YezD family protein, partial [Pirellulales bacterium]
LRRLGEALSGLRYGSVLAIVQDGVVVQVERTEKTRYGR